jgi:hypothetical protein
MYIELTGSGGASTNLIVPANKKLYFIFNNTSSGQVTVKVSGQTGISVPNGKKMVLVSNGTDIVTAENYVASLSTDNLSLTGNLTLSGGTANGVLYLNGSKVATSGSALTFDGTNLGIGTASPGYKLDVNNGGGSIAGFRVSGNDQANVRLRLDNSGSGGRTWELVGGLPGTNNANFSIRDVTGSTTPLTIDSSGNLGLGVTPSAWGTTKALEFSYGSFSANSSLGTDVAGNCYYNGTNWIYRVTGVALRYNQATAGHSWHVASGTAGNPISFTPAMTLDASGNLIVGGTSPVISGAGRGNITINGSSTAVMALSVGGSAKGWFYHDNTNLEINAGTTGAMIMYTEGSPRARITAGGEFVVGATATVNSAITSIVATASTNVLSLKNGDNGNYFLYCASTANAERLRIEGDGDVYNLNGTYGTISDERVKQDIVDAPSQWDDLKAVRFRKYRMKSDVAADPNAPSMLGVVAQELEAVCPGLVDEHTDTDGETTKTVKSSILLMKAAVALQEAMARIESLEADMAALKASA